MVVPVGPGVFSWFTERSNACGQLRLSAHLTTVVLRRLVLRMAHGSGGLCLVSDALRSRVFDLLRRDSKHSVRLSDTVSEKKIVRVLWVKPTPIPARSVTHRRSFPFV